MVKIFSHICLCLAFSGIAQNDSLSLERIFLKNAYRAKAAPALKLVKDGSQYISLKDTMLRFWDTRTARLVDSVRLPIATDLVQDFEYNEQSRRLLLKYDIEPIYRRSNRCSSAIFDLASGKMISFEQDKMVNPAWSKDGRKIAYTKHNNLYYYDIEARRSYQITFDGRKNEILNGQADWVYEEEFEITKTYWWNEEGSKIAFLKFDESRVKTFALQYWKSETYPQTYEYKYPKVGEDHSKVSLWVYDLSSQKTDSIFGSGDDYLPRVAWGDQGKVVFYVLNRLQNELKIFASQGARMSLLYKEDSDTYLTIDPEFWGNGKGLFFTSEKTGYRHIYHLEYQSKKCIALTHGNWDVLEISGLSESTLYFIHAKINTYTHRLSALFLANGKSKDYMSNGSNSVVCFSPKYIVVATSSVLNPPSYTLLGSKLDSIRVVEHQQELTNKLKALPSIGHEFMKIPASGYDISALLLRSQHFNTHEKHPVLIFQYSGPNYQMAVDEWKGTNFMWFNYLIQKGFVVLVVDPRGTGAKGAAFRKSTYLQLGMQESEDMALVSQFLAQQQYIDASKIHIFGWSFGGYIAALATTKWSKYFSKAVSVAPVTDWRYYDNVYTERYMQTPSTNPKGYDTTSVMKYCKDMATKLLLLHGTADDNVHIQHSYALQKALMAHNKQFDYFVFADKNHSIAGANTRYYLYKKVTDFLLEQ